MNPNNYNNNNTIFLIDQTDFKTQYYNIYKYRSRLLQRRQYWGFGGSLPPNFGVGSQGGP